MSSYLLGRVLLCGWCMRSDVLRRAPNGATAVHREMWGAARWDGPDGQLQQRIIAALQTADQSVTTYKQVSNTLIWALLQQGGCNNAGHKHTYRRFPCHNASPLAGGSCPLVAIAALCLPPPH
jgi:hypothetical protein